MPKVAIAGAGLVGALNACYFAQRGWEVEVYEYRRGDNFEYCLRLSLTSEHVKPLSSGCYKIFCSDIRTMEHVPGRSINLALSQRGKCALEAVGLKDYIVEQGTLENMPSQVTIKFDYSQEYIGHGYIELNILPKNGDYALEPNVFHVWPRGQLTLIALANRDKTFTVTIFAPFSEFEDNMSTPEDVASFFQKNFPDAYELLGKDHLLDTFRRVRPQPLVSIKCRPHDFGNFVLLAGDAAHAMAPFYGQGMNCVSKAPLGTVNSAWDLRTV
ncbi:hypothetical protein OSTOST_15103 [Ostertagia ostertagi]